MKQRAPNPTLPLARAVSLARLKRAGFTKLTSLKRKPSTEPEEEEIVWPESLIRKLAGYDD